MSDFHTDLPPELRQLAQSILNKLDPAVRMAAARAVSGSEGKCQQAWCPVCAVAALVSGEQHPLLGVIAEHGVALLSVVRAMTDAMTDPAAGPGSGGPDTPSPPTAPRPDGDSPPSTPGHYQHIPVTVED